LNAPRHPFPGSTSLKKIEKLELAAIFSVISSYHPPMVPVPAFAAELILVPLTTG
jgi:hypothetical protein